MGADIMVEEETKKAIPEAVFPGDRPGSRETRDTAVAIFEPLGHETTVTKGMLDDMRLFHETLQFYRKQDWDMAELRLLRLKTPAPGAHLSDPFLDRIAIPRGYPPGPDWDGAFTFQTK